MGCLIVLAWIWGAMTFGFSWIITDIKWKIIGLVIGLVIGGIVYGTAVLFIYLKEKKQKEHKLTKNANDNFLDKNDGV